MASLIERNGSYYVVYSYEDEDGKKKQKWETFHTEAEANRRKSEIEYHQEIGKIIVPHCETLNDLLDEYVSLYGKKKWSLAAYTSNTGLIKHYIQTGGDVGFAYGVNIRIETYEKEMGATDTPASSATSAPHNIGDYDYSDEDDTDYYDYEQLQREAWNETHLNPYGTEDCGDGYIDSDGVFTEY